MTVFFPYLDEDEADVIPAKEEAWGESAEDDLPLDEEPPAGFCADDEDNMIDVVPPFPPFMLMLPLYVSVPCDVPPVFDDELPDEEFFCGTVVGAA